MQVGGLENIWLMDFGCSRHMTDNHRWFSNLTPKSSKEYITFGDNGKGERTRMENMCSMDLDPLQVWSRQDGSPCRLVTLWVFVSFVHTWAFTILLFVFYFACAMSSFPLWRLVPCFVCVGIMCCSPLCSFNWYLCVPLFDILFSSVVLARFALFMD